MTPATETSDADRPVTRLRNCCEGCRDDCRECPTMQTATAVETGGDGGRET